MSDISQLGVQKVFDRVARIGATVAWTLIALVTFADVIGREVFSMPIPGGYEIIQVLMTVGVFFSLPIVALRRGHVRVDLLYQSLPNRLKKISDVLSKIVSILFFALLSWAMIQYFSHATGTGERTVYLHVPYWAPALVMAIFLVATAICCGIAPAKPDSDESKES